VYYDYSSNQGTILTNVATYRRHFASSDPHVAPQNLSLFLRPGADVQRVRARLLSALGPRERLYCVTNSEVRREALRIFESTFTITYALQVIAIVVAGLGVSSTLISLIYQRQREIGLLSLVGATPRQIRRVILAEAVIVGGVSQLLGIAIGIVLAVVLIFVINVQSFGWTIQFHLPLGLLVQSTVCVLGGSAAFGLYPAVRAANIDALQTVRQE
jgi:putative ABC transport system permease protein